MKPVSLAALLIVTVPLFCQIGRYPGGRGGIPGIPTPGRSKPRKTSPNAPVNPAATFTGTLRKLDSKSIMLELGDSRVVDFERSRKTGFYKGSQEIQPSEFKAGDRVSVEAVRDATGYLSATNVYLEESQPEPIRPQASEDKSEPAPVLKRRPAGDPSPATPEAPSPDAPDSAHPAVIERIEAGPAPDPLIEKARAAAGSLTEALPNYICQEMMARFVTDTATNWQPQDVVSAEVVYEDGRESYRNLAINGKPVKKGMEELSGSWSTGEFGTVLRDLFSPTTATRFRRRTESTSAGQPAVIFDFEVARENSHWIVRVASQSIAPAYRGAVWIEKATGRVLRIESEARNLPADFPVDKVESAVDYQYVRFGTTPFLLPVHAESLSCQRGTKLCSRNTIDFRNCRKYTSESEITFDRPK